MKIVMNTNYQAAGTKFCFDDIGLRLSKAGFEVIRNDWQNYKKYDLIFFMAPDSEVEKAKRINPKAITAIMDPKLNKSKMKDIQLADFLFVGSIEARDFFLKYNKNIFLCYMFRDTDAKFKEHTKKEKTIIGYHGNKTHLGRMLDLRKVLDELSDKYNIEFWAMYNIEELGKWKQNLPKRCPVKHIQWSEDNYYKYLAQSDIGIVPNKIPINLKLGREATKLLKRFLGYNFSYHKKDYLMRFKYPSNPARIYIFSQLSIPVVADFFPSACQIIQDRHSGFLVWSKQGWYQALEKLILSFKLRNKMSRNLKDFIDSNCSPDINFEKFLRFINKI